MLHVFSCACAVGGAAAEGPGGVGRGGRLHWDLSVGQAGWSAAERLGTVVCLCGRAGLRSLGATDAAPLGVVRRISVRLAASAHCRTALHQATHNILQPTLQ